MSKPLFKLIVGSDIRECRLIDLGAGRDIPAKGFSVEADRDGGFSNGQVEVVIRFAPGVVAVEGAEVKP